MWNLTPSPLARLLGSGAARIRFDSVASVARRFCLRTPLLVSPTRAYYRARFSDTAWRHVVNRGAIRRYAEVPPVLDGVQRAAVEELRRDGICVIRLHELLGEKPTVVDTFVAAADRALSHESIREQIAKGRSTTKKDFVVRALNESPIVDPTEEFSSLAISERVLGIVSEYLQIYPRLKSFDLWYNLPVRGDNAAVSSQRWHRDYEDSRLLKLFLLLGDVDETMGPFTFVRGSHPLGTFGSLFPTSPPDGSYPPEGAVEQTVPPEAVRMCTGAAGTVVLCETKGLHRGGRTTTRPRIVFTATYASNGAVDRDRYRLLGPEAYPSLSALQRYALALNRGPRRRAS